VEFLNEIMKTGITLAHVPMNIHPVAHLYLSLSHRLSISFLFFLAQRNVASVSSKNKISAIMDNRAKKVDHMAEESREMLALQFYVGLAVRGGQTIFPTCPIHKFRRE
jgi:hypothetical protein